MFAPKSAKAQSTQGRGPGSRSALLHPNHRSSTHPSSISDLGIEEAACLDFAHDHQAAPRASWSLAKIGISPHARDGQLQILPPFRGPRLPARIQTKLMVNEPGDEFEQEADRVADSIMWAPSPVLKDPQIKYRFPLVRPAPNSRPNLTTGTPTKHLTQLE